MSSFESTAFLRRLRGGISSPAAKNSSNECNDITTNCGSFTRPVPGQVVKVSSSSSSSSSSLRAHESDDTARNINSTAMASSISSIGHNSNNGISMHSPTSKTTTTSPSSKPKYVSAYRTSQFEQLLSSETVDLHVLRKLSWNGIPSRYRPDVWQMLLGYLPTNRDRRTNIINRKRKEYFDSIPTYYTISEADRTTTDGENLRQIQVDLPSTSPNVAFFQQEMVQQAMLRILYIWSVRHPASGYVQGMNDLLTPLYLICLQPFITDDALRCDVAALDSTIVVSYCRKAL